MTGPRRHGRWRLALTSLTLASSLALLALPQSATAQGPSIDTLEVPADRPAAVGEAGATAGVTGSSLPPVESVNVGGLETRTAALILSGQEAGDLAVSILPIPLPPAETDTVSETATPETAAVRYPVALVLDLQGASLLEGLSLRETGEAEEAPEDVITEIYAYALDATGGIGGSLTQAFRLDLATYGPALAAGGIKFLGQLELAPGEYSLRVLVRNRRTARLSLRNLPLVVPDWRQGAPVLVPPLVPEDPQPWIVVRGPAAADLLGRDLLSRDLLSQGWLPATRPLVASGGGTPLLLAGRGLTPRLHAHVVDGQGKELMEVGLGTIEPRKDRLAGLELQAAQLNPTFLPEGEYLLRLTLPAPPQPEEEGRKKKKDEEAAPPEPQAVWLPFIALPGEEPPALAWIRLGAPSEPDATTLPQAGDTLARKGRRQPLGSERQRAAYRHALGQFSYLDRQEARAAIVELEATEIGTGSHKERLDLAESQVQVALEVSRDEVETLVPLIYLHEQLYRDYHSSRSFQLSTHSRQIVARLAQIYAERKDTPEARQVVANALVSMAGYLQDIGAAPAAQKAFERALELNPQQDAALIGLGTIHEAYGHYEQAANYFEDLLDLQPLNPEARLRLAINLRRQDQGKKGETKKSRQAVKLFEKCLEAGQPTWIRAIAYQELANLHREEERPAEAARLLEEGLKALPGQQRMVLQLAAVYDTLARPAEARLLLDSLEVGASRNEDSPRLRYSQWPTAALERSRRDLAQAAQERLPVLADSLAIDTNPAVQPTAEG